MQVHDLIQGSDAWHAYRSQCDNASDAPAMMGESPYTSRSELIKQYATGISKEISASTQTLFDNGHRFERLARGIAEELVGEKLYPVTGSLGKLSASFDGLTMDHSIAYEHKTLNKDILAAKTALDLPVYLRIQMEQQLHISEAEKCLFLASKWDEDGNLIEKKHLWYDPNMTLRTMIIAGWDQFHADVAAYAHVEVLPATVAKPVIDLPSLSIIVSGSISLKDNLIPFGDRLNAFIDGIVKEPKTDQDFADAENAVKILQGAQDALEQAEASALAQTASIDEMRGTVKLYADLARTTRLALEKLVKVRKETIRIEIQNEAKAEASAYIDNLNALIGKPYMPGIPVDFAGAMKAKKTISSLRDSVATELSQFKIRADAVFKSIVFNITTMRELASEYPFLFADAGQIVLKATDDCTALIKNRINEHKESEAKRLEVERAKIAEEERIKAEAKIRAEQEANAAENLRIQKATQAEAVAKVAEAEKATLVPILAQQGAERLLNPSPVYQFPKNEVDLLETVTITKAEYERLLADSEWLSCLESAGVDNWEGYDEARNLRAQAA